MTFHRPTLALSLLLLAGCTPLHSLGRSSAALERSPEAVREDLNRAATSRLVVIERRAADGLAVDTVLGRGFAVQADSARWFDPATSRRQAIPTDALVAVTVRSQQSHILYRSAIGLFSGLLLGGLVQHNSDPYSEERSLDSGTLFGGGIGLGVGLIWGLGTRADHRYVLAPISP